MSDLRFIKISKCSNGWTVDFHDGEDIDRFVLEVKDSEAECWAEVLRLTDEIYGPSTGRHDKERVYVEVRPGDKFMDGKEENTPSWKPVQPGSGAPNLDTLTSDSKHEHLYCINCRHFSRGSVPGDEDTCRRATYHCLVHGELMNRTCHWEREHGSCGPAGVSFQQDI